MDMIHEICESTPQEVPESLINVIQHLLPGEDKNPIKLFFSLIYTLTLEVGFSPTSENEKKFEQSFYKSEIELRNFKFNKQRVAYFTQHPPSFKYDTTENMAMKFSFANFKPIGLFLQVFRDNGECLIMFQILVSGSKQVFSTVFEVRDYVVNAEAQNVAEKFSQLKELSITVKSMLARARTELLHQSSFNDESCLEYLPWHIQARIKQYMRWEMCLLKKKQLIAEQSKTRNLTWQRYSRFKFGIPKNVYFHCHNS